MKKLINKKKHKNSWYWRGKVQQSTLNCSKLYLDVWKADSILEITYIMATYMMENNDNTKYLLLT